MKKIMFGSLFFALALALCFSFCKTTPVSAQISSNAISTPNVTHLVSKSNETTFSLFDEFIQCGTTSGVTYYDSSSTAVSNRNVITNKGIKTDYFVDSTASGSATIALSNDYQKIANVANLFVSGSAGILSLSTDDRDKVDISISSGLTTYSTTGTRVWHSGAYSPIWVETNEIQLSSSSTINFSFATRTGSGAGNQQGFYLFDPCLNYRVEISQVTTSLSSQEVFAGQKIYLDASNAIIELEGGSVIDYYKNYFDIQWEITRGSDYAQIVDGYLVVSDDAQGETIKVKAKCKSSSSSNTYIYTPVITFTVSDSDDNAPNVISNFENGIQSVNSVLNGTEYDVTVELNSGYKFKDFEGTTHTFTNVLANTNLEVELKKQVSINEILIANKVYDGTTSAEFENINFQKLKNHDVSISGLTAEFTSKDVGSSINISGTPELSGSDSEYYELISSSLPTAVGSILKKDVIVSAEYTTQVYGIDQKTINYTANGLVGDETLNGGLDKETGTAVGQWRIVIGTLQTANPNYKIVLRSNIYEITKIIVKLTINSISKSYDSTTKIKSSHIDANYEIDDTTWEEQKDKYDIGISFTASFTDDENVGTNKPVSFTATLIGVDKTYFILDTSGISASLTGSITQAQIIIGIDEKTKTYGSYDPQLTWEYKSGKLYGSDTITGDLVRKPGENVGDYEITIGTLSAGSNYKISANNKTYLHIVKREVGINATYTSKAYGTADPQLTYTLTSGTEASDGLNLVLTRVAGETVGIYDISYTSYNENYLITSFTQGGFEILVREIVVNVGVEDKEYDSNSNAKVVYSISNLVDGNADGIRIAITAKFEGTSAQQWGVNYYSNNVLITEFTNALLLGNNTSCYNATFNVNYNSQISKRVIKIVIDHKQVTKEWGNDDPTELPYTVENGFPGMVLNGKLERDPGEEVGIYNIYIGTLTNENNPNYDISFKENGYYFEIIKRKVVLVTVDNTKIYGEEDPVIVYSLFPGNPLPDGVALSDIATGKLSREIGENVGTYLYNLGTMKIIPDHVNHYEIYIKNEDGCLTIEQRDLEITIHNQEKEYGEATPEFTYEIISGSFAPGETLSFQPLDSENAGVHEIVPIISKVNYNLTLTKGYLTITPVAITVTADNQTKVYRDPDPVLSYSITSGSLKFEETFADVFSGSIDRTRGEEGETGENVGTYQIIQNTFVSNDNYVLTFVGATFEITKRPLTVKPIDVTAFYDQLYDPGIKVGLWFSDPVANNDETLKGDLTVENINGIGTYKILQGAFGSPNYDITFLDGYLTLIKRELIITIDPVQKIYDSTNQTPQLTYTFTGDIREEDIPYFGIQLDCDAGKDVGSYEITATYNVLIEELYNVTINKNFFSILKKEITIRADDLTVTYGDELPEADKWDYTIVEGEVYNNEITATFSVENAINVGEYEILGSFENDENYDITYQPGKLTIQKKEIQIIVSDYEKIYGEDDPEFAYSFEDGAIINGDVLVKKDPDKPEITREIGEYVGFYSLILNLEHDNYDITMPDKVLKINKRALNVNVVAKDKVYDGTVDVVTTYTLSNIVNNDDVDVEYSAQFLSPIVSNNSKVQIISSNLVGTKSSNYYIVFNEPSAKITKKEIIKDNVKITVDKTNTSLTQDVNLRVEYLTKEQIGSVGIPEGEKLNIESGLIITLYKGDKVFTDFGKITVSINLNEFPYENFSLYYLDENDNLQKVETTETTNEISFTTTKLGTYVAASKKNMLLIYGLIGLGGIAVIGTVIGIIVGVKKRHRR